MSLKPIRIQFMLGYLITGLLTAWSLFAQNYEFLMYAFVAGFLVFILQKTDHKYKYGSWVLWGFLVWLVSHVLGGLFVIGDHVLYSQMLINFVGEPYSILKYDQVVHMYCYFIMALLLWKVVKGVAKEDSSFTVLAFVTVMAAGGIGGLNEIVEFMATVVVPNTNVGGYENTAIDIVSNLLGAILAVPFFKK